MKHSIRQRIINEYGLPVVKVEQVTGELGSGIFDKNGREIFENDIVIADGESNDENGGYEVSTYNFWIKEIEEFGGRLEIVGHVDD